MLAYNQQIESRPEIKLLIDEILLENARYKRELRSFHREPLVCPVVVYFNEDIIEEQHCVSRNISPAGISLISSFEFDESQIASLDIYRISKSTSARIVAECRWSKPFGERYWMSGWQFLRLQQVG